MKRCIIVINKLSGSSKKMNVETLKELFGQGFETEIAEITDKTDFEYTPADRIVVCGGDGTFSRMINRYKDDETEIVYCPCGTLNETSKRDRRKSGDFTIENCGEAEGKIFSYVLATGTFTPLGYVVKPAVKKIFKSIAYIATVLGELKVWRVNAEISCGDTTYKGQYSLLMVLDSPQCFGLNFNKMFAPNDGKMHLLWVKAPRYDGFFGLAEMFFSFFRAFFIGFKKPYESKKMVFREVSSLEIKTDKEYVFCADGERRVMPEEFSVRSFELKTPIRVVTDKGIKKLSKKK